MRFIHIECLKEWLHSNRAVKVNVHTKSYMWKSLECELCKKQFPDYITVKGKRHYLVNIERPKYYMVLDGLTSNSARAIHVIDMSENPTIKIGRGHDSDVRVTDISVSRCHALIKKHNKNTYYLEDYNSKFGTLVQRKYPFKLDQDVLALQVGRSMMVFQL